MEHLPNSPMSSRWRFIFGFILISLIALALRLPQLAQRPMHTDEAVHAIKFGQLLEDNYYQYNPFEYHGPTLNYFTLIPAWLSGADTLQDVTENTLRSVPLFFGFLLILVLLFLQKGLSRAIILTAALLTAISPAFVFFSRYYIQEMLLVFFTFAAVTSGYRYVQDPKLSRAIATGLFIGLMHATKETCIIAWFALGAALVIHFLISRVSFERIRSAFHWTHVLSALGAALIISVMFFSSFFTYPRGIIDSVVTFTTYFQRGTGGFQDHIYPFYYYFKWLMAGGEWPIFVFALAGIWAVFRSNNLTNNPFLRFIALYTIILTIVYSMIPYKTPWSMLGFYHGFVLLSAVGLVFLLKRAEKKYKVLISLVILLGIAQTSYTAYQLNYPQKAHPYNPYVYAHTDEDIYRLVDAVKEFAGVHPHGKEVYIEVVCPGDDYWPLPWYLRDFPNVGYWNAVDMDAPAAPVIIAKPSVTDQLMKKLYAIPPPGERHLYIPFFRKGVLLRPGVELDLFVVKEYYDKWRRQKK